MGIATSIPFVMLAGPAGGYFLGDWLDSKFGTDPYLMIICAVVGLVASFRETVRLVGLLSKIADDDKDADDNL